MRVKSFKWQLLLAVIVTAPWIPSTASAVQTDPAKASQANARVKVRVYLVRADDAPVVGAEVSVKGAKIERVGRSDSSGLAVLEGVATGNVVIRVRSIGLQQSLFPTRVTDGDNAFTITVNAPGTTLAEVRVVENRSAAARFAEFEIRAKRGDASAVITQAQIEKRNPIALSQMLHGLPGFALPIRLETPLPFQRAGPSSIEVLQWSPA